MFFTSTSWGDLGPSSEGQIRNSSDSPCRLNEFMVMKGWLSTSAQAHELFYDHYLHKSASFFEVSPPCSQVANPCFRVRFPLMGPSCKALQGAEPVLWSPQTWAFSPSWEKAG